MANANKVLANAMKEMQRMANATQKEIQRMVNQANSAQSAFNAGEAQKSRDWQEMMSKSAHQMEVEDLKKAGLNPVLSSGGSGAQSYTTSSASMTPESGASALASLQGSQLSAMSNVESARISAEAQKAAAAASAEAMKAAASTSAYAQMYGSDKAYEKAVKVAKIAKSSAIKVANINKGSTIPGAIEKALKKAGIYDAGLNAIKNKLVTPAKNFLGKIAKNPNQYFSNTGKVTANNFKLTKAGQQLTDKLLGTYGLPNNAQNRKLVIQAYVFGNQNAVNTLMKGYANHYKHSAKTTPRTGHK